MLMLGGLHTSSSSSNSTDNSGLPPDSYRLSSSFHAPAAFLLLAFADSTLTTPSVLCVLNLFGDVGPSPA